MLDSPPCDGLSQAARDVLTERFRFANTDHPLMAALLGLARGTMEANMERRPGDHVPAPDATGESAPPPGPAVDPVHLLQQDVKLPSLPEVVMQLQERIQSDSGSAQDMAEIISRDVGLSASLLRMVNSAFFSLPSQIETISRAVTVLGTRQLSVMALGTSVMGLFKEAPVKDLDMERFWRHSIACGLVARAVAQRKGLEEPERFFVAGLLHDLGRPAMFSALEDKARAVMARAASQMLAPAEQEVFGFNHARYGSMLLRKWNFPFFIVMAVLHHHDTDKAVEHIQAGVVHVADVTAQALGYGGTAGYHVQPLHGPVADALDLSVQDVTEIAVELCEQLEETCTILVPEKN